MATNEIEYLYALDSTGINPSNRIPDELHTISAINGDNFHVIIPRVGPYFADSLVITHTETGAELVLGRDYTFSHFLELLSSDVTGSLYSSITLLDRTLAGTFSLDYQLLGGRNIFDVQRLLLELSTLVLLPDERTFDDIYNTPDEYPVIDHLIVAQDLTGMTEVVDSVDRLALAVAGQQVANHVHPIDTIIGLEERLDSTVSNSGNVKLAPSNGYTIVNKVGALAVIMPKFIASTRIVLRLTILSENEPTQMEFSGTVAAANLDNFGDLWLDARAMFKGHDFCVDARLTYNEDGFPVVYIGEDTLWEDIHFVIESLVIDSSIANQYNTGWQVYFVNDVIGSEIPIERLEGIDKLHRKIKKIQTNSLFGEQVFKYI